MSDKKWGTPQLQQAVSALLKGELVAFPTETVYGLGADATNSEAVKKVFEAKGRPSDNPLIVHVASKEDVSLYAQGITSEAKKIMAAFWPGPLTLIFEIKPDAFNPVVTGGLSTAAFRMPDNHLTLSLIKKTGRPLVGPSANISGKPSPTTAEHVLHDLRGKIAGVLDDGPTKVGVESTVLDMTTNPPMILRPGAVTKEDLEQVIDKAAIDCSLAGAEETPKSPGMKYKHYAPEVPVYMIDAKKQNWQEAVKWAEDSGLRAGLLGSKARLKPFIGKSLEIFYLSEESDVTESMRQLFSGLRALDEVTPKLDVIFVETYSDKGKGLAYMNRLKKAANQKYFQSSEGNMIQSDY
ncbi:L-threonylcarbamoyladenylate synthase [Vagococcus elongatus]|uniref:Threonylcarbamoyl-AMP synthase n=1 Tax=Vagococcus elongatus TaxID=180344 RepID=A0A430AQA5_9ENTE|nr:L-threonylcarbamoyladenylate synthase [Vagococcus elongatus]RSU10302.1 threonylcarbamoyl-AMP synthase [Vagococcus elongatus]